MAETIILDPTAVAGSGRSQLDITGFVDVEGPNWGDAEVAAYMADQARGSSVADYRVPNRTVTIPLVLRAVGSTSFDTIREQIQAKVALFQREGGWLSRTTSIGTVYADVVNATLKLGGSWLQAYRSADIDAELVLECLPDFYGAEVTLSDHVNTSGYQLIWTETGIEGDYPGRLRVMVDNDEAAVDYRAVMLAIRSRHYSSSADAALVYTGASRTPVSPAVVFGDGITNASLTTEWQSVMTTQGASSGTNLVHTGSYRVRASVISTSANPPPEVRLLWGTGTNLATQVENAPYQIPTIENSFLADLGEVRLDPADVGIHRWKGIIQARGANGGENVLIGRVYLEPLDESWTLARASTVRVEGAGTTTAKYPATCVNNAAVGTQAWTDPSNAAGGPTGTGASASLTAGEISNYLVTSSYSFAIPSGATIDGIAVYVTKKATRTAGTPPYVAWGVWDEYVRLVKGGVVQTDNQANGLIWPTGYGTAGYGGATYMWGTTWTAAEINASGFGVAVAAQAISGTQVAFVDAIAIAVAYTTADGNLPSYDAVAYRSRSVELRWDGAYREDYVTANDVYVPVAHLEGDLPRIPPSGLEGRTVQFMVKPSRGDFDTIPDSGTHDDISAQAFYRPCWLYVPS